MPLHEYECGACSHRFEVIQKFSDPPIESCPKCGGPVRKLIASPAFQFKGSGWYVTDYARKEGGGTAAKGDNASPDKESSTSGEAAPKSDKSTESSTPTSDKSSESSSATGSTTRKGTP
jgi:putative FmdB family regulatory protein